MKKLCENAVLFLDPYVVKKDRGTPWLDCRDNYEWYFTYGKIYQPKSILEVGVRYGYSVFSMCKGSGIVDKVVLVDNEMDEPGCLDYAQKYFNEVFPLMEVVLYKDDSSVVYKSINEKFDLVHIDANHKPMHVQSDFRNFWPLVKPGGTMILDDMRSLAGENTVPLAFHIIPILLDTQNIRCWNFINNYNNQIIIEKKE